jgi:hypothetical protein
MVVTAFRQVGFTFDTTPWPTHVTLDDFRTAFDTSRGNHFGQALLNSTIIGAATTAIAMLVGTFAAYAVARLHFRGKFLVLGLVLSAAMFPGVALVTPLFQLFTRIHWLGTYQALIIPDWSRRLASTAAPLPRRSGSSSCRWPHRPCSPPRSWSSSRPGTNTSCPASCPTATPQSRRSPSRSPASPGPSPTRSPTPP